MVSKGTIDLRGMDLRENGPLRLDGQWEFYWGRYLAPMTSSINGDQSEPEYITIPSLWDKDRRDGIRYPGRGHATYRLTLLAPATREMTLCIQRIFSGFRVFINGVQVGEKGMADSGGRSGKNYIFVHNKSYYTFFPRHGINEIIIHVVNKEFESGGIDKPLLLEDAETAARINLWTLAINMVVLGVLLFVSFYNMLLYYHRRQDVTPLLLGLYSIVWAINTYNIQFPILSGAWIYPHNPYVINYLTIIVSIPLCMMTIRSLFPDDFSNYFMRFSQGITILFIIPLLLVGFKTAEQLVKVFLFIVVIHIVYCVYVLIQTLINKRDDAMLFVVGFGAIFAAGINNILYALWITNTGNMMQFGMVILCVTSSMVITRRFSRLFHRVEELSIDLEKKNSHLQKVDVLKDQFLANTSHELRTPLHGMIGLSQSLIDGNAGILPEKVQEDLSLIASSGHRMATMVNDLLDLAKIQNEGLSLNLRPINIHALSDTVVKLSLPLLGSKSLVIENTIDPHIPRVNADEDRIRQVLYNLVGNAIKFTEAGTIMLSARIMDRSDDDDDGVLVPLMEISVSDTGIGVPEEYQEAVFETYRQVDGGDTRLYPGTGLGLAISRKIVEHHGGSIRVVPGPDGGSVFSFTIPVSIPSEPDSGDAIVIEGLSEPDQSGEMGDRADFVSARYVAALRNTTILVVDDDPINIRIIRNCFETRQCIVLTASDGISALEMIEHDRSIDLVLLDIMMPVLSGFEVCRRIRASRPPEDLPVIMLTAKNMMADIDAAFAAGANDYIVKPFQTSELLARVSTMLKLKNIQNPAERGIVIRDRNRSYSFKFGEIIYVTSHLKNSIIHTSKRDIEVPVILKEIITRLPPDCFVRIHKSYIINLSYLHSMSHVLSGRYQVRLKDADDTELPVGPAFLEHLRKKIAQSTHR